MSTARTSRLSISPRCEALAQARGGHGPVFLLCETERLTGHYIGDPQVYRDKDELDELRETRDPITNLRERLGLSEEEWARLDSEAQRGRRRVARVRQSRHRPGPGRRTQVRLRGRAVNDRYCDEARMREAGTRWA